MGLSGQDTCLLLLRCKLDEGQFLRADANLTGSIKLANHAQCQQVNDIEPTVDAALVFRHAFPIKILGSWSSCWQDQWNGAVRK